MRPTFLTVITTALLALAAVLPSSSAAQRRPVPERSGTPARPTVTPRGNHERRAFAPRRAFARPATTCRVIVQSGLEVGTVELLKVRSDDGMTWAEVGAVTGYRMMGPESGNISGARRPRIGIVSIEALDVDRVTLSVTAPTRLQGADAGIPFTGEWAVSDRPTRGYVGMAGSERDVILPPSGRIYVRLGGRVAYTPDELPAAKQWQGEEYRAEWIVHVSSEPEAGARARVPDCFHMVAVPVSVILRQNSACTMTASPDGLDFGGVRRTRVVPHAGYTHTHSVSVNETQSPADVTLTDTDHLEWVNANAARGWMSVYGGDRGAIVQASFPATIDHTSPPADHTPAELIAVPYAPTWAYHLAPTSSGDEFTPIDTCIPPCAETHRIPDNVEHEVVFGGTAAFDHPNDPGEIAARALPGSYGATIAVSTSCL